MDAPPPPQATPPARQPWLDRPAYFYAATEIGPRPGVETELCEKASRTDWLYMAAMAAGVAGSTFADFGLLKFYGDEPDQKPGVRLLATPFIGLFWGGLVGGTYLSLPKCDRTWVGSPPPEGDVRPNWQLATALGLLAAGTAPALVLVELGPIPPYWPVWERSAHFLIPAVTGFLGALVPYVLPPRTWSAKKQLDELRFRGDVGFHGDVGGAGGRMTYTFTF